MLWMHRILRLAVAALVLSGCAGDLARASAGAIGCPHKEIDVDDVSVGWSQMSWTAQCRGTTFHCSGENGPICSPQRDDQPTGPATFERSAPAPAQAAPTPPPVNATEPPSAADPRLDAQSTEPTLSTPDASQTEPAERELTDSPTDRGRTHRDRQ